MGQPTPPGDIPLVEGLGPEWNEIVNAFPEDRRGELSSALKERVSTYEPLKEWEDLHKAGISPADANNALNLYKIVENNPRDVYETLGKHLGITPAQAEQVVEQLEDEDDSDPEIARLKQQVETLTQITLAQRQQESQAAQAAQADAEIEAELGALKKKYGEFSEDEIVMRMLYKDMTAEQAYQDYSGHVTQLRTKTPSPMLLGGGGVVPTKAIDPVKLDSKGTKDLVTQMLEHARGEK